MKKKIVSFSLILALFGAFVSAFWLPTAAAENAAEKLTPVLQYTGVQNTARATDGSYQTYASGAAGATLHIIAEEDIGFVYLGFHHAPEGWTLSSATAVTEHGKNGFLHEYAEVAGPHGNARDLTLTFPAGVELNSVTVYGKGEVPADVQVWEPVCEQADLMLVSAHADDEQLFFAGIIPYYARVRGVRVQVVFFTDHPTDSTRWHERLDALWACGCRNYPVVSPFPAAVSYNQSDAYRAFSAAGYSEAQLVDWLTLQIRMFRPLAVVTHSLTGERNEGQHMAAADAMTKAAVQAADSAYVTEGKAAYDLPKLYLRGYTQNRIVLDGIDTPSDILGGKTPFQLSQEAYLAYGSRVKANTTAATVANTRFFGTSQPVAHPEKITVTRASQITEDSPLQYGLYRKGAGVADDVLKNDFLENLNVPAVTSEITTAPRTPETTAPLPPVTTVPATEPGTAAPETESAAPGETSAPGKTVPETTAPSTEKSSADRFSSLQQDVPHTILWVCISAVLGAVVLALVLGFGIRAIRRCNNR